MTLFLLLCMCDCLRFWSRDLSCRCQVLIRMLEKLESKKLRAQVALVATEDRADVTFEDQISDASSVLVDHRKKRIKRMARFWLGEGLERPKPHLRQPPWAWKSQSALANLIEDLPKAYEKELGHRADWTATELLKFLQKRLEQLNGKVRSQRQQLSEEVALDTEDFPPVIQTKADQTRLEMETLICQQLRDFSAALEALSRSLENLLRDFALLNDEAQNFEVQPPQPPQGSPGRASVPPPPAPPPGSQFRFSEAERRQAYRCVTWPEDPECVEARMVRGQCGV